MLQAVIVVIYFAITLVITFYMQRKTKNTKDFMIGSGALGILGCIPMMFGETIAGSSTTGGATRGFTSGLMGGWYSWGLAIGCILCIFLSVKFFRVMGGKGATSLGHAFEMYFSKRYSYLLVVITCVVYLIYYALQPVAAAGIIAPMFGISTDLARWIVSAVFIITAACGGIKGLSKINFMHAMVMWFGLLATAFLAVRHVGGFTHLTATLPPSYFNIFSAGPMVTFCWALGNALSMPSGAMVANMVYAAKNEKTAKTSLLAMAIILIPFGFFCAFIGVAAKAGGIEMASPSSALYAMASTVSPVIGGLASMAVLAAVMSSAPAFLIMFSNSLVGDVYARIRPDSTDKQRMIISRVSIVVIGIICTWLGGNVSSVLGTLLSAMQIRNICAVVLIATLVWKRVNEKAAFWSLLIGGVVAAVWFFMGNPYGIEPILPSCIIGIICIVVITLATSKGEYEGHRAYVEEVKRLKEEGGLD